ncbi:LacI family DNA-binding transcriptional regulator [Curtobacterium flaccumfaciens]|nr:LacI family DNA-binding transcriptional regulator [Curtobacterium flaccumfaciens]
MPKAVTLSDVAREAGVDLSTASRVLRGTGRVSEATRQRIRAAADRLDFRPNAQAQFLATGISKTVGVLTINGAGTFTLPVMAGLNSSLGREDVATLLYDVHEDEAVLRESVKKFRARQIDGLLVLGDGLQAPLHSVTANLQVPVVYAFATSDSPTTRASCPTARWPGDSRASTSSASAVAGSRRSRPRTTSPPPTGRAGSSAPCGPPGCRSRSTGRSNVTGHGRGGPRPRGRSWTGSTRWTRCSAATTRSRWGSSGSCGRRASASPRTSRSSATTTGRDGRTRAQPAHHDRPETRRGRCLRRACPGPGDRRLAGAGSAPRALRARHR